MLWHISSLMYQVFGLSLCEKRTGDQVDGMGVEHLLSGDNAVYNGIASNFHHFLLMMSQEIDWL